MTSAERYNPPSKDHPDGEAIERHEQCATNPSKRDILTFDEIQVITEKYKGPPKANILKGYANADTFDIEIRGWPQYWNEIFTFTDPLEPDLVKALNKK